MKSLRQYEEQLFKAINPAVRFSVTRYVLSIGLFVGVVLFGIISFFGLGVDLLPSVNIPVVAIFTNYPGATPEVVDQQVTQQIENVVSTLSGITDINSSSSTGSSRVILSFNPNVNNSSVANEVAAQVSAAVRRLPSGISPPTVRTFDPNSRPILEFGIYAGSTNLATVSDFAQNVLTPYLERIDGVANVSIEGGPGRNFQVLLDPNRLAYYKFSPNQVVNAITGSALNQPIGSITADNTVLTFTTQNMPTDTSAISKVLIDPTEGVTVGDVATVRDVATASNFARVNGKPVVLVSIQKTADGNSVATADNVRKFMSKFDLPPGYQIFYSNDTTVPIKASINATYRELILTAAVVAFVVLLFLGRLNTALSVILAIPIALSASPILYHFLGYSLNLVSLLALIVAIGIVVDDSIVVSENVERHRAMGASRMQAVLQGSSEVFSAVAAASLSLFSVLIPVSFIGGFAARYLQQFSLGLAAAVIFSWFEALLFLTVRLAYTPDAKPMTWLDFAKSFFQLPQAFKWGFKAFRRPFGIVVGIVLLAIPLIIHHIPYMIGIVLYPVALSLLYYVARIALTFLEALTEVLHGWTERALDFVRSAYTRSLGAVLKRAAWVLIVTGLFFVATLVFILPKIPFNFVPQSDNGSMEVHMRMPSGTATAITNQMAGRVESFLLSQPAVETVQTVVGGGGVFGGSGQATNASMTVQLVPTNKRPSVFVLIGKYRQEINRLMADQPSARVFVSAGGGFRGQGSAIDLTFVSTNFDLLMQKNNAILQALDNNKWVGDATSSLSETNLENDFVPNTSNLNGTGISPSSVAQTLLTYTSGSQAGSVDIGGQSYPINVQIDPKYLSSEQSLLNLPVYSPTLKANLQVGQLGSFVLKQAPISISRYNRLYTAQYSVDLVQGAPPALEFQTEVQQQLTKAGLLGNGITMSSGSRFGAAALSQQLSVLGPEVFGLSLLLVYLVMGAQFNSFRYPIYLLLPVPLALIGALWFVYLIGGGLDIFGVLGMLMLIGLSAKNAILYLDFVVDRIGRMPFVEALIESAKLRFRPIVMTTVTVLVISFPLILGHGEGSEFGQRLGVVMLGGVLFSAILTFFVVPSAFYLFERKRGEARETEHHRMEEIEEAAAEAEAESAAETAGETTGSSGGQE